MTERDIWVRSWALCLDYGNCQKHSRECFHCRKRSRCVQIRDYEKNLPKDLALGFEVRVSSERVVLFSDEELLEKGAGNEETGSDS